MCRPDLTIIAYYWDFEDSPPLVPPPPATLSCAEWKSIEKWLQPRTINYTADGKPEAAVSRVGKVRHGFGLDE
jgi:hypothetical protein